MRTLLLTAAAIACVTSIAQASDLNLLCKSELTAPNGTQTEYLRQYEINTATRDVTAFDDYGDGKGFQLAFSTRAPRLDPLVVVIAQRQDLYHEINRVSGMSFSRNAHELRRGICSPSQELPKQQQSRAW